MISSTSWLRLMRRACVILDWVANHTAWDNPLVTRHPDWYARDWNGDFRPTPWSIGRYASTSITQSLKFRRYMTASHEVLGQRGWCGWLPLRRCGFVPTDFWNNVRKELDAIKPASSIFGRSNRGTFTPKPST